MQVGDLVQYVGDNSSPRPEGRAWLIGMIVNQRIGLINGIRITYQQVMWGDKDYGTTWLNPILLERT